MKKRLTKLLLLMAVLIVGSGTSWAQTDVTATYLTNAAFEGDFSVSTNPNSDRAIYQPNGWTVAYSNGDSNDMTALNSSCLAWNNFSSRPQPTNGGNNTYWIRFRWGSSENLILSQSITLPAGTYKLSADAFFNGANGASATIFAGENSKAITGNSTWGNYGLLFVSDGTTPKTIGLKLTQSAQVENIAAFDNFKLEEYIPAEGDDLTDLINNWDFQNCGWYSFPGWTISAPNGGNVNNYGDAKTKAEFYKDPANEGQFDYYQIITGLPKGRYTLSASMWHTQGTVEGSAGVYADNGATSVYKGVTDDCNGDNPHTYNTNAIYVPDGTLRLGVKNNGTMGARWFGVDWIKLTFEGADMTADDITAINAAIPTGTISDAVQLELNAAMNALNASQTEANYMALSNAIVKAKASISSYETLTNGLPDNSIEGWTCTNSNTFHINTWTGPEGASGISNPYIENWIGSGDGVLGTGDIYYELPYLNPGIYTFTATVRARSEAGNNPVVGASVFAGEKEVDMTTGNYADNNTILYDEYSVSDAVGEEDPTFRFGAKINNNRNYNWILLKGCQFSYEPFSADAMQNMYNDAGDMEQEMDDNVKTALTAALNTAKTTPNYANYRALEEAIAAAKESIALHAVVPPEKADSIIAVADSVLGLKMSNAAQQDLQTALNNYNEDTTIKAKFNELETAIANAEASVENYIEAKDILDAAKELDEAVQNAYAADETVAAIQAAYNNGTLEAVTAEQKTACETALNVAFLATLTNVTDFTQQKYLLKNIASGKYLGAGNNWGTQASLVANAEYNILIPKGEGVYNIDTQVSSGGDSHFFNGSFMDGAATDINICKKPSGEYLLLTDSQVFGYDGKSTVLASNVALTSENALWEIVSVEDAIADFANATEQNPKDATFLIEDHNFGRNNRNSSAWSHGNHTNFTYSGTNGSSGADYVNNVGESWHSKFYLEQKLENIPNGIYRLYAQGFYEEGADNSSLPYFFANNETLTFTKKTGGENSRKTAGASFLKGQYINGPIEVTVIDGNLTIGAKNDQNESIWVAWDNFTLEFVSPLATATSIEELAATQGQVILNINGLEVLDNNETGEIVAQSLDSTPTGIVLKETGNINGASSAEYGKTINAMLLGTYNADLHAFTIEEHVSNKITVSGTSSTINNMDIAKATEKDQAYLLVKIENATIAEKQGVFYATSGNDEIKIDKRLDPTIKVNDGDLAYEITGVTFLDGDVCVLAPLSKNAIVDNKAEATEGDAYDQGDNVTEVEGTIMTFGGDDEEGAKYEFEGITPEVNGFASKTAGIGKLPVDAEGKSYDKTLKNVPTQGTYYKFVPTKDGQLAVTVGLEKGKTLIVTEDGEAIKEEKQAADLNGDVAFPVEATKTYYVFATDADLAYYGFNFTPTDVNADNTAKDIATFKLLPEAEAGKADKLMLNDAVVTYIKGDNVFVEDASGAIDFYQTQIQFYVGQKLNGYIEGCNTTIDNMPVLQRVDGKTKYTTFKVTEKGTPEATAISPADAVEQDNLARFTKMEYVELQNDRQGFRVLADPQTGESVRVEDHFNVFYELGDLMEKVEGIVGIDREGTFIFWPTSKDGVVISDGYKKATETELDVTNKTVAGKKDNPVEGISITLASACNAGSGSSMAGAMTSKGYKLRTANGSPVKESATFTVNQGKKVYDMTINGIANYAIKDDGDTEAAAIKVTKVEVDGKEVSFEGGEFPAKGASDCGTLTLKDINATKQIVLYFDNSNAKGTQVNIAWSVNYGEKVFTSKELSLLEEAKELAKDRDAIAVGCLDDAIEAAEAGDTEGLAETVAKFKAANADTEADATDKVKTDGWKKFDGSAAGVCATQYAPAITTYDGRTAQLAECYEGNAEGINRTGTIIYQDITGLTNGTYKVAFYSNAFYTSGRGFDSPMSDGATDVAYVYANDKKEFISARIATETDKNSERQFTVQVTDGTIKLGLGKEKAGTNWHTIQIGQLTWFTTARQAFDAEKAKLQAAIDEAEGLLNSEQGGNKANLQAAVDEANASMVSNRKYIEDITEDVKKLQEAIAAFHEIGTVYVKHVATGMYLAAGKSWGTQAVLNETGLDLKFDYVKSSGKFNIDTQISNGGNSHYLGSNGYCDAAAFGWTVTQLSNGNYTIGNGSQYLCSTDNEIVVVGDNADEWQFVNAEELEKTRLAEGLASLQKATKDNGVDATFLIKDANFNRNDLRWSVWNVSEDCTNKNLGGGCDGSNSNGCAESYHSKFTISQVVANAPAGTYTLTAQGFYRQDDGETEDIPYIFANDEKVNIGEKTGDENSMTNASYSFDNGLYALETITVVVAEDGTLTVGVKGTATHQWVIWDNFQLTYYGNGGTPTAISEIEAEPVRFEDGAIYNLRGVKVEGTLKPGLYIKNGKKIVIK